MAVALSAERHDAWTTANATTYTLSTFTPGADTLLVCCIWAVDALGTYNVVSVADSGGGNAFTNFASCTLEYNNGIAFARSEVWYRQVGASPGSHTPVVTFSEGVTGTGIWLAEFTGFDTTTPIKQGTTSSVSSSTPSISLSAAPDSDSLVIAGCEAGRNEAKGGWTSEAGWTDQSFGNFNNPPMGGIIATADSPDQTYTASGTVNNNSTFILEIDAASGGGGPTTDMFDIIGGGYYPGA